MAVPYHTHTFEIPTATPQDMAARAANDKAVTPSVLGTAATADISQFATAEQGKKADSAVQPQSLKNLAYKDKITVDEINTNGAPSNTTFLSGSGWQNLTGGGDMTVAIYDPQNKRTDAFDMANMKEADNAKVMTADERNRIANLDNTYLSKSGGTIIGDLIVDRSIKSDFITTNGWLFGEYKGDLTKGTAGVQLSCSQNNSYVAQWVMRGDGSTVIWTRDYGDVAGFRRDGSIWAGNYFTIGDKTYWFNNGDINGPIWQGNSLHQHIENRAWQQAYDQAVAAQNRCITDSRVTGWAVCATDYTWNHLPSGYFATAANRMEYNGAVVQLAGRQPQLYIASRGWFPLGGW